MKVAVIAYSTAIEVRDLNTTVTTSDDLNAEGVNITFL